MEKPLWPLPETGALYRLDFRFSVANDISISREIVLTMYKVQTIIEFHQVLSVYTLYIPRIASLEGHNEKFHHFVRHTLSERLSCNQCIILDISHVLFF